MSDRHDFTNRDPLQWVCYNVHGQFRTPMFKVDNFVAVQAA